MPTYRVTGNFVLLEPLPAKTQTTAGILLPPASKFDNLLWKVVAVGPGRIIRKRNREDVLIPTELAPGDNIVLDRHHGNKAALDDGKIIVDAGEILAKYYEAQPETAP